MSKMKETTEILAEGCFLFQIGQFDDAEKNFRKYLSMINEKFADKNFVISLQNIGICLKKRGNYEEAIKYYEKALQISKRINYIQGWADNLSNIGVIYKNQALQYIEKKEYKKAEEYLDSAEKIYKEAKDLDRKIRNLNGITSDLINLGIVYTHQRKNAKAIGAFEECINISKDLKDYSTIGKAQGGIGRVHISAGNFDKAIFFLEQSLKTLLKTTDFHSLAISTGNLGTTYYLKKEMKKAEEYLSAAVNLFNSMNLESPEFKKFKQLLEEIRI